MQVRAKPIIVLFAFSSKDYQNKTENLINQKIPLLPLECLRNQKKFIESNLLDRIGIQVPQKNVILLIT